ncbi:conserved Plasmodium protein, unknown function [Plasmodium vinckei vinckei]|uniref:NE-rich protein n=1 Tax=Plasmodium vinckei vinckei TaxID=54757 RepID=A0A081ID51_PLAVN|nr:conserved Plasmodium protein, unknown function [Plasmodium vinckei vinckei]KEG01609.1 hypothetical protein YYE_03707 [Plasmodium vinckei vinckei]VEV55592.1 conserved Plasmodium protein, unknown function [Plasmodium vinckei vinckei]
MEEHNQMFGKADVNQNIKISVREDKIINNKLDASYNNMDKLKGMSSQEFEQLLNSDDYCKNLIYREGQRKSGIEKGDRLSVYSKVSLLNDDYFLRDGLNLNKKKNSVMGNNNNNGRHSSVFNLSVTEDNTKMMSNNFDCKSNEHFNGSLSQSEFPYDSDLITPSPSKDKIGEDENYNIKNVNFSERSEKRNQSIDILDAQFNNLKNNFFLSDSQGNGMEYENDGDEKGRDEIENDYYLGEYASDSEYLRRTSKSKKNNMEVMMNYGNDDSLNNSRTSNNSFSLWENKINSTRQIKINNETPKKGILKQSNSASPIKELKDNLQNNNNNNSTFSARKKSVQFSHRSIAVFDDKEKISPLHLTHFTRISSDSNVSDVKRKSMSNSSLEVKDNLNQNDNEQSPIDKLLYKYDLNNSITISNINNKKKRSNIDFLNNNDVNSIRSMSPESARFKTKTSEDFVESVRLSPLKKKVKENYLSESFQNDDEEFLRKLLNNTNESRQNNGSYTNEGERHEKGIAITCTDSDGNKVENIHQSLNRNFENNYEKREVSGGIQMDRSEKDQSREIGEADEDNSSFKDALEPGDENEFDIRQSYKNEECKQKDNLDAENKNEQDGKFEIVNRNNMNLHVDWKVRPDRKTINIIERGKRYNNDMDEESESNAGNKRYRASYNINIRNNNYGYGSNNNESFKKQIPFQVSTNSQNYNYGTYDDGEKGNNNESANFDFAPNEVDNVVNENEQNEGEQNEENNNMENNNMENNEMENDEMENGLGEEEENEKMFYSLNRDPNEYEENCEAKQMEENEENVENNDDGTNEVYEKEDKVEEEVNVNYEEMEKRRNEENMVLKKKLGENLKKKQEMIKETTLNIIRRCRIYSLKQVSNEKKNLPKLIKLYEHIRNIIFQFINKINNLNNISIHLDDAILKYEIIQLNYGKTQKAIDALKKYNSKLMKKIEEKKNILDKQSSVLDNKNKKMDELNQKLNNLKILYDNGSTRKHEIELIKMYKSKLEELKKVEIVKGVMIKSFNKYGIIFELLNFNYYNFSSLYEYNEKAMNSFFTKESLDLSVGNSNAINSNNVGINFSNNINTIKMTEFGNSIIPTQDAEQKKDTILKNKNVDYAGAGINRDTKEGTNIIETKMKNLQNGEHDEFPSNERYIQKTKFGENFLNIRKEDFSFERNGFDIYELYQKEYKLRYLLKKGNNKKAIFMNKIEEQDLTNKWPYNITIDIIFANIPKPNEEIDNLNSFSPLKLKSFKHLISNKMHLHDSYGEKNNIIVDSANADSSKYLGLFRPYKILIDSFKSFKEVKITTYYKYINNENIYNHIWNRTHNKEGYTININTINKDVYKDLSDSINNNNMSNEKNNSYSNLKNTIYNYSHSYDNKFVGTEWKAQLEILKYKLLEVINKKLQKYTNNGRGLNTITTSNNMNNQNVLGNNLNDSNTVKPNKEALKYLVEESEYCFIIINHLLYQYKQLLQCFTYLSNTYFDYYQNIVVFKTIILSHHAATPSLWLYLYINVEESFSFASLLHGIVEVKVESVHDEDEYNEVCKIINNNIMKKLEQCIFALKSKPIDISERVNSYNLVDIIYTILLNENYNFHTYQNNLEGNIRNIGSCDHIINELINKSIIVPIDFKRVEGKFVE